MHDPLDLVVERGSWGCIISSVYKVVMLKYCWRQSDILKPKCRWKRSSKLAGRVKIIWSELAYISIIYKLFIIADVKWCIYMMTFSTSKIWLFLKMRFSFFFFGVISLGICRYVLLIVKNSLAIIYMYNNLQKMLYFDNIHNKVVLNLFLVYHFFLRDMSFVFTCNSKLTVN